MITVRFPTGLAVTYNKANFLSWGSINWEIRESKDGKWIASIPAGTNCIVEVVYPCKVENTNQVQSLDSAALLVRMELKRLRVEDLRALKYSLENFNRQTGKWRD